MTLPVFTPGQVLTALDVNTWFVTLGAVKTAQESVINSTTLQDDDHLFVTVAANARYKVSVFFDVEAATTPDFKGQFVGPAGSTHRLVVYSGLGTPVNATEGGSFALATSGGTGGASDRSPGWGNLTTAGTAGTFKFQFAQNTLDAVNATVLKAGSWMVLERLV